jgi:hypothetical protein
VEFAKSEAKQWAREHYHGLCGTTSPSFTPDLTELDEEGIRHDVRNNIAKGVFSVFCQVEICALIFQHQKDAMRAGVKAAGITPPENEEEFYVSRLNYAKGLS